MFSCKHFDLLFCVLLNLQILSVCLFLYVLVSFNRKPMHVAPGAASDSCNFPQPTVFIFSMAGCGIPCEAMLHVFTSACEQNLRASSCMPLRAHVHLICVANCFTILHPLHPSSSIVAFATCPNLTPMSVVCGMLFFRSIGFSYLYYACCFIISLMG